MKIRIHPTLPNLLEKVWQNELNQPDPNIPKLTQIFYHEDHEGMIRPQIGFKLGSFGLVIVHLWIEPEFFDPDVPTI